MALHLSSDLRTSTDPRGREVARILSKHGLERRIGVFSVRDRNAPEAWPEVENWARASADLGAVFTALAHHLGTRPDLLGWRPARRLAKLPDRGPAMAPHLLADTLPDPGSWTVEPQPESVFLERQIHRAQGPAGERIEIHLCPPGLAEQFEMDSPRLDLWARLFSSELRPALAQAVEDFRTAFSHRLNFDESLDVCAELAAADLPGVAVARPIAGLRGTQWAAFETLDASPLVLPQRPSKRDGDLARDLVRAWLAVTLDALAVPERPCPGRIGRLPDGRLTFGAGPWTRLEEASPRDLEAYLDALLAGDVEAAFEALEARIPRLARMDREALWRRFRQLAPQRDGGWDLSRGRLVERIILHWRLLTDLGHAFSSSDLAFFRSLVELEAHVRRLAPGEDAVVEVLVERQWLSRARRLRQAVDPSTWIGEFQHSMTQGLGLPLKLEEALRKVSEGELSLAVQARESPWERRRKDQQTLVAAGALAFLALVLVGHRLGPFPTPWGETLWGVVVLALGGLLLALVGRDGPGDRPAPPRHGDER